MRSERITDISVTSTRSKHLQEKTTNSYISNHRKQTLHKLINSQHSYNTLIQQTHPS